MLGLFATSGLVLIGWIVLELNVDEPLVDIRVLAERPVLLTNATALISGFAMFGSFVLVPRFAEAPAGLPADVAARVDYGFGASATMIGMYLLARVAADARSPARLRACWGVASAPSGRSRSAWRSIAASATVLAALHDEPWQVVVVDGRAERRRRLLVRRDGRADHRGGRPDRDRDRDGDQHRDANRRSVIGAQVGAAILTAQTLDGTDVPAESAYVSAFVLSADRRRRGRGDRRLRDARPPAAAPRVARDGARMSVQVSEARQVAEAVERLLLTLVRQRHGRDPEPGSLSTFQSIALSAVADDGPLRLGTLADALGTTDATASRTVDALEDRGLAERRPDPGRRAGRDRRRDAGRQRRGAQAPTPARGTRRARAGRPDAGRGVAPRPRTRRAADAARPALSRAVS